MKNNCYLNDIDIEKIKRAINVEEKYKYIDIMGRETSFSGFMIKQLYKIYKLSSKNAVWLPVIEAFEHYSQENILQRKKTVNRFVSVLKKELKPFSSNEIEQTQKFNIYETDISSLKGIG